MFPELGVSVLCLMQITGFLGCHSGVLACSDLRYLSACPASIASVALPPSCNVYQCACHREKVLGEIAGIHLRKVPRCCMTTCSQLDNYQLLWCFRHAGNDRLVLRFIFGVRGQPCPSCKSAQHGAVVSSGPNANKREREREVLPTSSYKG